MNEIAGEFRHKFCSHNPVELLAVEEITDKI